jgi:hypothetical protein
MGASTRLLVALIAAIIVVTTASTASASRTANQCIAPDGTDLNQFYNFSDQIVAPFCTQVDAGENWSVVARWFVNFTFASAPDGFVPAGTTPVEDFLAKFAGVKYVLDPDTSHEKVYLLKNKRHLWAGSANGFPLFNTLTMGTLQPLSVGPHVVKTYWLFSAMHCDGFGDVLLVNCFLAGETLYSTIPFEVTS